MSRLGGTAGFVPDAFYEFLAYSVPGGLTLVGLAVVVEPFRASIRDLYRETTAVDRIALYLVLVVFCAVLGQLQTVVSYWLILPPLGLIARAAGRDAWRFRPAAPASGNLDSDYNSLNATHTWLTMASLPVGLELRKRRARAVMARNNAVGALIVSLVAVFTGYPGIIWPGLVMFALFALEAYYRRVWVNEFAIAAEVGLRMASGGRKDGS